MCGITGVIGKTTNDKEGIIKKMNHIIHHRGPDDDGFFVDDYVGLAMRRLSIIDVSHGKQPIESADGSTLIFFNGEIYNYRELRDDLITKGYVFKTESDTEVILHSYQEYGEKAVLHLRGMFAFCIYNKNDNTLFIARDYFGIKPLYYLKQNGEIKAFGSEIKSILLHPDYHKEVNHDAVFNYLFFQYNPLQETFFKNIYKLPPAHYLKIDLNKNSYEEKRYWSFSFDQDSSLTDGHYTKQALLKELEDSVSHHMIADVPVGSFLSGGIDSSVNATLMQKFSPKKISTFTVGFEGLSEGAEAKVTSDALGTHHHEYIVSSEEYFKELPNIVWHFDEPVADPSAVGLYFIAREAGKKVKVVLSGEGADELFGGYNIYREPIDRSILTRFIPSFLLSILRPLTQSSRNFKGKNFLKRYFEKLEDWYIGNASIFKDEEVLKIWKGDRFDRVSLKPLYRNVEHLSESTQMQYIDINTWLPGDILAKADKMTMAHSLELRVPFLDIKIANFARELPDNLKWKNHKTKYLLREAVTGVIPNQTRLRKKLGFPTPLRAWLTKDRTDVYETIQQSPYIQTMLDSGEVKRIIEAHTSGVADNSRKIYTFLMLALWYDTFFLQEVTKDRK